MRDQNSQFLCELKPPHPCAARPKLDTDQKRAPLSTLRVLALVCCLFLAPKSWSQALSNLLPKSIVQEMSEAGINVVELDDPNTPENKEIAQFWNEINQPQLDVTAIVDQLFGSEVRSYGNNERKLYSMKYLLLRDLVEKSPQGKVAPLVGAWQKRYLATSYLLVALSDVEEIKTIAANFQARLKKGEVKLVDLSPARRAQIDKEMGGSHGVSLLEKLPNSFRYQVSGFYEASTGTMGVDFSRSVEENFVTMVHEMVHAADPRLEGYRQDFKKLWPDVSKILAKFVEDPNSVAPLDAFDGSFEKEDFSKLQSVLQDARAKRLQTLENKIQTAGLSDKEKDLLRSWVRAAIGLTLENEYRAYSLSIVVYARLRDRYRLFVDNQSVMREYIERLIAGDKAFAILLSTDHSAMDRIKFFLRSSFRAQSASQRDILQVLEYYYLQELEQFLKDLNDRYASVLPRDRDLFEGDHHVLFDWARPGGWDSPTSPYQILTARLTTAWTIAFSENLKRISSELQQLNEPLWLLHAGVLDLHDINIGELKLLGIHYSDSPYSQFPSELSEKLRQDVDSLPPQLRTMFQTYHFDPVLALKGDSISGLELTEKLVGLRLMKASVWLDEIRGVSGQLGPLNRSVLGTKTFLEKLERGLEVDVSDLTPERRKELESELKGCLARAEVIKDQLQILQILGEKLGAFSHIAEAAKMTELARNFLGLSREIQSILENYRIYGSHMHDPETVRARVDGARKALLKQLHPLKDTCYDMKKKRQLGFFPNSGPYTIDDFEFHAMVLCWDQQMYLVRQPGDFSNFMTTTFRDNRPQSRIFMGARPIVLEPIGSVKDIP